MAGAALGGATELDQSSTNPGCLDGLPCSSGQPDPGYALAESLGQEKEQIQDPTLLTPPSLSIHFVCYTRGILVAFNGLHVLGTW